MREEQEGEDADGDGCVLGFQDELGFGGLEAEWAAQVDRVGRELKRGWRWVLGLGGEQVLLVVDDAGGHFIKYICERK